MKYPVVFFDGGDGWIVAECPALPGCVSQGETREEAFVNIREAIELTLEVRKELGWSVPEPSDVMSILETTEVEL
jgi:predicted RNase H-like HicB family nuclease